MTTEEDDDKRARMTAIVESVAEQLIHEETIDTISFRRIHVECEGLAIETYNRAADNLIGSASVCTRCGETSVGPTGPLVDWITTGLAFAFDHINVEAHGPQGVLQALVVAHELKRWHEGGGVADA